MLSLSMDGCSGTEGDSLSVDGWEGTGEDNTWMNARFFFTDEIFFSNLKPNIVCDIKILTGVDSVL